MWLRRIFVFIFFIIICFETGNIRAQGKIVSDNPYYTTFDLIHYSIFTGVSAPEYFAAELIDSEGKTWIQQKLKINERSFNGAMALNYHMPTGFYWIRAYPASFIKNVEPQFFLPLIIINSDDLEADLWKEQLFKYPEHMRIITVGREGMLQETHSLNLVLTGNHGRILQGAGYMKESSNGNLTLLSSDEKGIIRIPKIPESGDHGLIILGTRLGDSLRMNMNQLLQSNPSAEIINPFIVKAADPSGIKIKIIPDKSSYHSGETVRLRISTDNPADFSEAGKLILLVREANQSSGSFENSTVFLKGNNTGTVPMKSRDSTDLYTGIGYILHVKYVNASNGLPRANYSVALVSLGQNPDLVIKSADRYGNIYFDASGIPEDNSVFISTIEQPIDGLTVNDNYFRTFNEVPLIYFDKANLSSLETFVSDSKIRKVLYYQYYEKKSGKAVTSEMLLYDTTLVYSKPDISYNLNDYIQFADMPEVIREILPYVNIKKTKSGERLTIYNNKNTGLTRNPLFLINGIPTRDVQLLLSISTHDLQRIDLLYERKTLEPYGLSGFGGIMAVYTSKPQNVPNSLKIDFKGFHHPVPEYSSTGQEGLPDLSPVVYWNPAVNLTTGSGNVEFKLNDLISELQIKIIGFDRYGNIFQSSILIKVDENQIGDGR